MSEGPYAGRRGGGWESLRVLTHFPGTYWGYSEDLQCGNASASGLSLLTQKGAYTSSFNGETSAKEGGARFLLCRDFICMRDASRKVSPLV